MRRKALCNLPDGRAINERDQRVLCVEDIHKNLHEIVDDVPVSNLGERSNDHKTGLKNELDQLVVSVRVRGVCKVMEMRKSLKGYENRYGAGR